MKIFDFPHYRQTYEYDCGATALQMILAYYGIDVRNEIIMELSGTNSQGTPILGLKNAGQKYGLKFQAKSMTITEIKSWLNKKIPVILIIQAWSQKRKIKDWTNEWHQGHYTVAIGYDNKKIYFADPATANLTYLTYRELNERWHDQDKGKKYLSYGLVIYGKNPKFKSDKIVHLD